MDAAHCTFVPAGPSLTRGEAAFTPFVGAILPSHDYTYFAHSAVGRDLRETTIGFYTGVANLLTHFRSCGCPSNTYLQSRLAYSFVEHVLGRRVDHADMGQSFGAHEILPRCALSG